MNHRALMRLRSPSREYAKSLLREAHWRVKPRPTASLPLTWSLDQERLSRAVVRLPLEYRHLQAARWLDSLVEGLRMHVRVTRAELPQPFPKSVAMIRLDVDGKSHSVAIDYSDYPDINEDCRRRSFLYFKMQFLREGYSDDGILPGGYPPSWNQLYPYLGHLRARRVRRNFSCDVHGRFSQVFAEETRTKAVKLLEAQDRFNYLGGLDVVRYSTYLNEISGAKVCVDLPGKGDLCFRLVDYLAVGSCVVGPRPRTSLHVPLVDRETVVHCRDDLSDLVALCAFYVEHDEERERIAAAARNHFDRYLDRRQWGAYYLHSVLSRLG